MHAGDSDDDDVFVDAVEELSDAEEAAAEAPRDASSQGAGVSGREAAPLTAAERLPLHRHARCRAAPALRMRRVAPTPAT
jgi:hypothetical protein